MMRKISPDYGRNFVNVLVVDVGGTNVKMLATGEIEPRRFPSGPAMTVERMIAAVKELAANWRYDVISMGYPGVVVRGKVAIEPYNLPPGWTGFDYERAFGCPVKVMNDAAMQALGSYQGGELLFLGLGTGLGSALVYDGVVIPMELGHLSYKESTYEDYVGARGLQRLGTTEWTRYVTLCVDRLVAALHPDDVVLGGGNAKRLESLPAKCRLGDNALAFVGGFRLWENK
jgi:polyphosphate glucokinase